MLKLIKKTRILFLVVVTFCFLSTGLQANSHDGVILKMNFDNNISDLSGNNLDSNWIGTASYVAGNSGQAASLKEVNDNYVLVKHNDKLVNMSQLYISIWAKKNNANIGRDLIRKHGHYVISITDRGVTGYVQTENGNVRVSNYFVNEIQDTNWHHYVLSYDGKQIRLLVDGNEVASALQGGTVINDSSRDLYIGKHPWGVSFDGQIDQLEIRNNIPTESNYVLKLDFNNNIIDKSGNDLETSWIGEEKYTTGNAGQALDLSVADDNYVVVPHTEVLTEMKELYISVWAKKNNADIGGDLLRKHTHYKLGISERGVFGYVRTENGGVTVNNFFVDMIRDTNWHHYELSYDGIQIKLIVDGNEVASALQSGTVINDPSRDLYIGKHPWGSAFEGQIDDLEIKKEDYASTAIILPGLTFAKCNIYKDNQLLRIQDTVEGQNVSAILELTDLKFGEYKIEVDEIAKNPETGNVARHTGSYTFTMDANTQQNQTMSLTSTSVDTGKVQINFIGYYADWADGSKCSIYKKNDNGDYEQYWSEEITATGYQTSYVYFDELIFGQYKFVLRSGIGHAGVLFAEGEFVINSSSQRNINNVVIELVPYNYN